MSADRRGPALYGLHGRVRGRRAISSMAARRRARGRLPPHGRLHALPDPRLTEALGLQRTKLPLAVLSGDSWVPVRRLLHAVLLGRRRLPVERRRPAAHSWPAFIPITFEMTILFAAFFAVFGMLGTERAAEAVSPGLQRPAASPSPRATASSSASRRRTRSSIPRRPPRSWPISTPGSCRTWRNEVARRPSARAAFVLRPPRGRDLPAARTCTTSRSYKPLGKSDFFDGRSAGPLRTRRHGRPGLPPPRMPALHRPDGETPVADAARRAHAGALRGGAALRHLLRALPRPDGQRARHGRPTRVPAASVFPHRPAAGGARRATSTTSSRTGFGAMPDYASQIPVEDRWAIAAYVRALQLSQGARMPDLTAADRSALERPPRPPSPRQERSTVRREGPRRDRGAALKALAEFPVEALQPARRLALAVGASPWRAASSACCSPQPSSSAPTSSHASSGRGSRSAPSPFSCSAPHRRAVGRRDPPPPRVRHADSCRSWRSFSCRSCFGLTSLYEWARPRRSRTIPCCATRPVPERPLLPGPRRPSPSPPGCCSRTF